MFFNKSKKDSDKSGKERLEQELREKIENEIVVHTMPEKFMHVSAKADQAKKMGILIFAISGIILIIFAVFLFFYLFKKPSSPAPALISPTNQTIPINKEESPSGNLEPEEAKPNINVDTSLELDTDKEEAEEETPAEEEPTAPPVNFTTEDTDQDGLYDLEEDLLGTNKYNVDSDGDSYHDLAEVLNLYDPGSSGKLADNPNIAKYINQKYNYSLLYPEAWSINQVVEDSVIFKSENNQVVQINVQPNPTLRKIEDWFEVQFGRTPAPSEIVSKNGWRGVASADGLIVYLTDKNHNFIYIVSYTPEFENLVLYKNIFQAMINSFIAGEQIYDRN